VLRPARVRGDRSQDLDLLGAGFAADYDALAPGDDPIRLRPLSKPQENGQD
jgi:hypothetical protein